MLPVSGESLRVASLTAVDGGRPILLGIGVDGVGRRAPLVVGFPLGDVVSMVVAIVALAVLGLAVVVLKQSGLLPFGGADARQGTPETERESRRSIERRRTETEPEVANARRGEAERQGTDTQQVVQLLETNDGRMRQATLVDETGWSKSKVSMVLSEMEENDDISKLRVGRENLVTLRGQEPEAAGSPFDDE